jgi:hypothetical protein
LKIALGFKMAEESGILFKGLLIHGYSAFKGNLDNEKDLLKGLN